MLAFQGEALIVYLTSTVLTVALVWLWKRKRRWWIALLAMTPLTLASALRWNVGTDFRFTYLPEFRAAETMHDATTTADSIREFRFFAKRGRFGKTPAKVQAHFKQALARSEPLHRLLVHGAASFGVGFRSVVAVYAILTAFCIFVTIFKSSRWPSLAAFLYVGTGNYFLGLNIMRQFLAVGIGLVALSFVLERKTWQFILCVALATCCHYSALVLLPIYALSRIQITPKRSALIVCMSLALSFAVAPILQILLSYISIGDYARYFKSSLTQDGFEWIFFAINICFLTLGAWYWEHASHQSQWYVLWYGMTALGTAALAFSGTVPLIKRINYYYAAPQFLLLPEILLAEDNLHRRRILTVGVVVAFAAETIVSVLMYNKNGVLPYRIK